ncbi:DUF3309 domain-containing protein [Mesorhizobium sp. M00.F.Ca.ET.186.01.1.1]|nr:DUF3309 domain-containing protein [bacterium M00.F.Ca.ET.205.01.1.1]TGU50341.1 DUF3309 domain-containing protein [bacterium M00.F.Ca.ET.152.01.1.1]TGV33817.1 DUF3309 domain-containing protein [Mesorhizobium sp. M00.F.Ca.ET.186.01.1.1]TGZ40705.1 DUF3309 domain-containing protein [bacterium M00.F.Ca.ET.162.01.1.1]
MTILGSFSIITVMLVLIYVLPIWPWSRAWAYRPAKVVAAILLVPLVLLFANKI